MKIKIITALLILFVYLNGYSQNENNKAQEFFDLIKCETIVSNQFSSIETNLLSQTKSIFENYGLDFNDKNDVIAFENFLKEELSAFKEETYNNLLNTYSTKYSKNDIQKFIDLLANKSYKGAIIEDSNLKSELEILLNGYKPILSNDINLTLEKIGSKHKPLKIEIYINNKLVTDKNIPLDLILNIKNDKAFSYSIFNKDKYEIILPKTISYSDIVSLTLKYNNQEYTIERYRKNIPKELQELMNPISEKSFTEIGTWKLEINDKKIILDTNITTEIEK